MTSDRNDSDSVTGSRSITALTHALVQDQGLAEITMREAIEPAQQLFEQRPVETELLTNAIDRLGRGLAAGDRNRGIAGQQLQQHEHQHREDHDHGNGLQQPTDHAAQHVRNSR